MKDTNFYNAESRIYADKRYPAITADYIHYFFKRRLAIVLDMLQNDIAYQKEKLKLLEIGCADGVVIRKIEEKIGDRFSELQGIDLSSQMIEVAKKNGIKNSKIKYAVRDSNNIGTNFYVIIEAGVINYTDFLAELKFVQKSLRQNGYYILSIASNNALAVKLGKTKKEAFNNLLSYADYENKIIEYFDVIKVVPCGFWLPGLWKLPVLARIVQPILDFLFSFLLPNFFHEKVYLLKIKE